MNRIKSFWQESKEFWKDILVIISRENLVRTFWIIIIILIAASSGGLLRLFFKLPCHWNGLGVMIGISGCFISIVGIFISARIMMEVERKKTKTMEDYLRMTRNIVRNAHDGDHIYVIGPTFCAGITTHKRLLENLYKNIEVKKKENVNFNFAFLKTDTVMKNRKICFVERNSNVNIEKVRQVKPNDFHWKMISPFFVSEIERDTKNVGKYKETREEEIRQEIKSKINLVNSYEKRLKGETCVRYHLSRQTYLKNNNGNSNVFGGFFASVNLGKLTDASDTGQYYLGYFHHDGEKTIFKGTSFEVEGIGKNMKAFLDSFLKDNGLKE